IPPIGAALGIPSPFMQAQPGMFGIPGMQPQPVMQPQLGMPGTSPFAHPASSNPFIETGGLFSDSNSPPHSSLSPSSVPVSAGGDSPFAQPYSSNPFGLGEAAAPPPAEALPSHAFSYQMDTNPSIGSSLEERAARLSQAYAAEFGLTGALPTA